MDNFLEPRGSLTQRAIRSGAWVFALQITNRLFMFVRTIILARLLAPNDFGLFGITLLVIAALEVFSQTGFKSALIQKKENTNEYLDTAWTVSALRGIILFAILFFTAPLVALFFKVPEAKLIVRIVGVLLLLDGFANIGIVYFKKELEFNKQFIYQLSGILADVGVAITLAFILRSVWALVWGLLAGGVVRCIVSYFIHPYRPHIKLEMGKAKELFTFGKWLLGGSIVTFLATQGDDGFLGKVLGVTALGFYQLAFRFASLPGSEIGVISRVAFPTYSKLQDDIPKLRNTYLKVLKFVTFFAIPLAGGIFILGPEFTRIFLGEKWLPMVPALKILAITMMIKTTVDTSGALFNGIGRPDITFKMVLVRVIILAAIIYPLTILYGIAGTALSVLLGICLSIPVWLLGTFKEIKVKINDYLSILWPPLVGTVIMSAIISALKLLLGPFQLIAFLISTFAGIVTYFGFIFLAQRFSRYAIFKDLRFILASLGIENRIKT
ncbi:lipopolysaccharide biosynthesis protein [candidate division WOR-3 bacterium]|nr:lipopolysaccharide biosynthesis protein [candidate division WOR-3 bacterium]